MQHRVGVQQPVVKALHHAQAQLLGHLRAAALSLCDLSSVWIAASCLQYVDCNGGSVGTQKGAASSAQLGACSRSNKASQASIRVEQASTCRAAPVSARSVKGSIGKRLLTAPSTTLRLGGGAKERRGCVSVHAAMPLIFYKAAVCIWPTRLQGTAPTP